MLTAGILDYFDPGDCMLNMTVWIYAMRLISYYRYETTNVLFSSFIHDYLTLEMHPVSEQWSNFEMNEISNNYEPVIENVTEQLTGVAYCSSQRILKYDLK